METISRGKALDKMLLGIYGNRNVNFENQKVIINDDRIRKTLFSPTSINNVRSLFEVTFKDTAVKFEDKKKGKSFDLDREKVIDNTTEYFKSFGIGIPNVVNKTERKILGKRMCNAILEHILPVIFSNISTKKGKVDIENDDISSKFNKAVERIQSEFSSGDFFEQLYVDCKASDVEKLNDSEFLKDECNFGVLVCSMTDRIFDRFNFVPTISYYACNDNEKPTEMPKKENNLFEEITSKLVSSLVLDNKNFVSPYYYTKNSNNVTENESMEYTIHFNVDVPNSSFIPRYSYFMTRIDNGIIEEKYAYCESATQVNLKLIEKAIRQIRSKYTEEITEYYHQILANIEILCSKFLAIDIERVLSQNIHSIEDFKKALKSLCNNDDIDKVWDLCKGNGMSAQQASRYIYCGIEAAIQDFLFMISDSMIMDKDKTLFLHAIEDYIPKASIAKHTNVLSTLLKKARIDELSQLRVKNNNFNWNSNAGLKMYYRNDVYTLPMHDKSEDVYRCLKSTISYYCNTLNEVEI